MEQKHFDEKILSAAKNAKVYRLVDTEAALIKTKEKIGFHHFDQKKEKFSYSSALRIAASVLIAASIGTFLYLNKSTTTWTEVQAFESAKEFRLPDGSLVTLNKNSILRVAQKMTADRQIQLEGEAFFEVKRDPKRPFIVTTGEAEIVVLGTSFNILSNPDEVQVSVSSGKVQLREKAVPSNFIFLEKGASGQYKTGLNEIFKSEINPNYLSWKTGIYIFNDTPVIQALQLLAERHKVKITFENTTIESCLITSVFDNQTWKEIIQEFSLIHSLKFEDQIDGTTLITGGNCN